jgi:hypothetical protein
MRPLSARQATACENATGNRCRCRCGGLLHGARRFTSAEDVGAIRRDDPHYFKGAATYRNARELAGLPDRPAEV